MCVFLEECVFLVCVCVFLVWCSVCVFFLVCVCVFFVCVCFLFWCVCVFFSGCVVFFRVCCFFFGVFFFGVCVFFRVGRGRGGGAVQPTRRSRGQSVGGPKGWSPQGGGPKGGGSKGGPERGGHKKSHFCPPPGAFSHFLSSHKNLMVFDAVGPPMCSFGVLGLSCETPVAPKPRGGRRGGGREEGKRRGGGEGTQAKFFQYKDNWNYINKIQFPHADNKKILA